MKKLQRVVWGIVLIAVGAVIALNALNITDIDLFFDGWWTLFIIVPAITGLLTEREKTGNLIALAVGVGLFLGCRDIVPFSLLWKLFVPAVIVVVGVKLLFAGLFDNKAGTILSDLKEQGRAPRNGSAVFSGTELRFDGEPFEGAELTAVFGGVECDLRGAVIEKDCAIQITAIFGGVDVLVPEGVNVKVRSNCLFGGISNKTAARVGGPTLYISGTCMFGGADIK